LHSRAVTLVPKSAGVVSASLLEDAVRQLLSAAEHAYQLVFTTAEQTFSKLASARSACILTHSGGSWRPWDQIEMPGGLDRTWGDLPVDASAWTQAAFLGSRLFVPVRAGSVAVLIEDPKIMQAELPLIGVIAAAFDLALTASEWRQATADNLDGLHALQRVATPILKSHELEEILLLITHEAKQLLSADICGILLREGDVVVMQRCVGNFSAATASLRMRAGQGVAGRVFATHEACRVEDYLRSSIISQDFFELARTEMVRSALAAPLLSHSDVVGVLEVWRRRPSTFTERDAGRLVALANLTSLAIENARLSQNREAVLRQLADTNEALQERYEAIHRSATFQQDLIRLLLERKSLSAIATEAAGRVDGTIYIINQDLGLEGAHPRIRELAEPLRRRLDAAIHRYTGGGTESTITAIPNGVLSIQPIAAGAERFGWVASVTTEAPDESMRLALSQVCMASALHQMERRAAARARAETLETVLWDVLEDSEDARRLALSRARELHVDLAGHNYVFLCSIDGIETLAGLEGWTAKQLDERRRLVREACERMEVPNRSVKLSGMRGNLVGMICGDTAKNPRLLGQRLAARIATQIPGLAVHVGASGPCKDPTSFPIAYREARISLEVARLRGQVASMVYSDVGIVGLLMSLREDTDLRKVVENILGPLLMGDARNRTSLLETLGTFFELNCSRRATAKAMRIHEKTICYRLAKVTALTGLDLNQHEDRLVADLALRIHRTLNPGAKRTRAVTAQHPTRVPGDDDPLSGRRWRDVSHLSGGKWGSDMTPSRNKYKSSSR
jgi:sugar diacid utilization regulator/GAF domain-containing protein